MQGYALHRRLDKLLEGSSWGVNTEDEGDVHDWRRLSSEFLDTA
jgi:hypothetical protein